VFPNKPTQFQPGESGNPGGSSRKRRISGALARLIDATGDKRPNELALIVFAMATGQRQVLEGREPDLGWFKELRSILGEDHEDDPDAAAADPIDPAVAERIMQAANPDDGMPGDD